MFRSETTKKIASNTVYQIAGKIISMLITVAATMIVTRTYGRAGYGEFSLMQNWPAIFFIIADFGLNAIATRELSKDFRNAGKYLGTILIFRSVFSLALIALVNIALVFFPYSGGLLSGLRLSLFLILTQALFATTNIIFQVKLRYDMSTVGNVAGYLVLLTLILMLSFANAPVSLISFTYVIGGIVTFFLNMRFISALGIKPDYNFDSKLFLALFLNSLPLGLMFVFSQINFKVDGIMLSVLKLPSWPGLSNTDSVAIYSLPYKVFEVALVVPTFFMNSVYPVLVAHMMQGRARLESTFKRTMGFLLASGAAAALAGYVFSPLSIKILGGSEFAESVLVLRILLGGLVLYYLTQPVAWLIVTLGHQKKLPAIYLASALFNIVANYLLIPVWSFYASAVITHVSEFIILILLSLALRSAWKTQYA